MNQTLRADLNDPVTKHLRTDFSPLDVSQTVGQALVTLRERQPQGRIIYFYVTDSEGVLQGVVPTRRLLLSPPETPVASIMIRQLVTLPDTATVLDACEFFTLHRLLAFPVIDPERRLLGFIDVELYTDELSDLEDRSQRDDLFQLIGVHLPTDRAASAWAAFRQRFPWLLCNITGGLIAAWLTGLFEKQLEQTVALALFIPVVLALAESVSIQSVSLALQGLHGRQPRWRELPGVLAREALTGIGLGVASATLVSLAALGWLGRWDVAACLLGGITGGVTAAAVVGLAMPYLLRLMRRDPQVAAGPTALTIADMITLLLYFNLASQLI